MRQKYKSVFLVSTLVALTDLLVKNWILGNLRLHEEIPVIAGYFNINYVRNPGAAFGLMADADPEFRKIFFALTTSAAIFFILILIRRSDNHGRLERFSLSLILGGAIGNAVNRFHLGYVVDFLHVHWRNQYHFPSFNLADIAICTGVALILLNSLHRGNVT